MLDINDLKDIFTIITQSSVRGDQVERIVQLKQTIVREIERFNASPKEVVKK